MQSTPNYTKECIFMEKFQGNSINSIILDNGKNTTDFRKGTKKTLTFAVENCKV